MNFSLNHMHMVFSFLLLLHVFGIGQPLMAQDQTTKSSRKEAVLPASPTLPEDRTVRIVPRADVDERLFLVHALYDTYRTWTNDCYTIEDLHNYLDYTKVQLQKTQARIRSAGLGNDLDELYQDAIRHVDDNNSFLVNCGMIDKSAVGRASREQGQALVQGAKYGSKAFDLARKNNYEKSTSLAAAGISALLAAGVTEYFNSNSRDEERRQAFDAQVKQLKADYAGTVARAKGIVSTMTEKFGWEIGEAAFDDFPSGKGKIDVDVMLKRRPRDAFLLMQAALHSPEKAANLGQAAERCIAAAGLVPGSQFYDGFRSSFMCIAAHMALLSAQADQVEGNFNGNVQPGKFAVQVCRTAIRYLNGQEVPEWLSYDLAQSLMCAGRYLDALEYANMCKNLRKDAGFQYNYACILSRLELHDEALNWLRASFANGFPNDGWASKDPDFAPLREAKPAEFAELMKRK